MLLIIQFKILERYLNDAVLFLYLSMCYTEHIEVLVFVGATRIVSFLIGRWRFVLKDNNMKEPFDFPTLDDNKDVDADVGSAGKLGNLSSPFDSLGDSAGSWLMPLALVGIWVLVFVIELIFTGVSAKGLSHWPVVMGETSHIAIIKPVSAWIAQFATSHGAIGLLLGFILKIASVVVMAICVLFAGFIHASWGHLFGNILVFLILCGILFFLQVPLRKAVREWFVLNLMGIGFTWLIVEVVSFVAQFLAKQETWLYAVSHSITPIVGASVGIYGLLGFTLFQTLRHLRQSRWVQLVLIVILFLVVALLYARWTSLSDVKFATSTGAALLLGVIMHYVGFGIGCLHGLRTRLPIDGR
jgi:membrane associated rhomboid family serine protease